MEIAELEISYSDHPRLRQRKPYHQQLAYWREQLAGMPTLRLPTDHARPKVQGFRRATAVYEMAEGLVRKLREMARRQGSPPHLVLLAGFAALLQRYSGQQEVVIATPIAKADGAAMEGTGRPLINTLALRVRTSEQMSYEEMVKEVSKVYLEAYAHQDIPFDRLAQEVQPDRNPGSHPLFQVWFVLLTDTKNGRRLAGIKIKATEMRTDTAKYDWAMWVTEFERGIRLRLEYNADLYERETINRALGHYARLLSSAAADARLPVGRLGMLGAGERRQLFDKWNKTELARQRQDSVQELIQEQARQRPDALAVVCGQQGLTYGELNARANRLASYLHRQGVGEEKIIGVVTDRSPETILAILAVLKAGGAYLPLEPDHPAERLKYMLADCGVDTVLSLNRHIEGREWLGVRAIDLTAEWGEMVRETGASPRHRVSPDNLAYAIYTSGSTGRPKGVLVQHGGLTNFVQAQVREIGLDARSRVLQFASLSFDASVTEIFPVLVSGGTLYLAAREQLLGGVEMEQLLQQRQISLVVLPPSILTLLSPARLPALESVISVGEPCPRQVVRDWSKGRRLYNGYGPTETTVGPLLYTAGCGAVEIGTVPIGRPITNTRAYLLDRFDQPVPIGVAGEIAIGGDGLARGYVNQPRLTAERFAPDPFGKKPGSRLYRTGDLGRRRSDGNIEYITRIDQQVKIRGCRVELGEVEDAIKQHPSVQDACVVATHGQDEPAKLAAYVVLKDTHKLELWPSVAEYFIYDDLLYQAMTGDERRNQSYKTAISRLVKDKVVVDIGTGRDAILARFCAEAGARRVYAVELLEAACNKARELIRLSGLEDKVILIQGDVMGITLPEAVEVCVSEIVGAIGGAEGAAVIINDARRHMKKEGVFIPERSLTKIAAVTLPQDFVNRPAFTGVTASYCQKIFAQVGTEFDLRVCIKGLDSSCLISDNGVFEDLDFSSHLSPESQHSLSLKVTRDARMDGLLVWLSLETVRGEIIDILEHEHCWLPVYLPLFHPGIEVQKGDLVAIDVRRTLADNGINPDYRLTGQVIGRDGQVMPFIYESLYNRQPSIRKPFYKSLFAEGGIKTQARPPAVSELKEFLREKLPEYMVPAVIERVGHLPLTINGKVDRKQLTAIAAAQTSTGKPYVSPTTEQQRVVAKAWEDILSVERVGVEDNFFDIGGHSLLVARLSHRLTQDLGKKVSVLALYRFPTISSFVSHMLSEDEVSAVRTEGRAVL